MITALSAIKKHQKTPQFLHGEGALKFDFDVGGLLESLDFFSTSKGCFSQKYESFIMYTTSKEAKACLWEN